MEYKADIETVKKARILLNKESKKQGNDIKENSYGCYKRKHKLNFKRV